MLKCDSLDLDRYFERVCYSGTRNPSLKTLISLCWSHVQHIPWDTLDLFGGLNKELNLDKIYKNLVCLKRGGWCYEHNGLFGAVLEAMGFSVVLLEGSCFITAQDQFSSPHDHLLLKVEADEKSYIVDVGYGVASFFEPMLFNFELQKQMTGIYRIREYKQNEYFVEKQRKTSINTITGEIIPNRIVPSKYSESDDWEIISRFSGIPQSWNDFEKACQNHQEDKNGYFRKNSFVELFHPQGVDVLWGTKLIERIFPDPLTEKIKVTDLLPDIHPSNASPTQKKAIFDILNSKFGIKLNFWPIFMSENYHAIQ